MNERELETATGEPRPPAPRFGPISSALISVLIFSSLFALSDLLLFALFIAPMATVPLLIAGRRPGFDKALATAALGCAAVALVFPLILAIYPLFILLPVLSVLWWERYEGSEGRWVALSLGVATAAWAIMAITWAWPLDVSEAIGQLATEIFEGALTQQEELGLDTLALRRGYSDAWPNLPYAIPGSAMIYVAIILFWVRSRLTVLGYSVPAGRFEDYRSWEWLPVGFIATGAMVAFAPEPGRWIGALGLISVCCLFFVGGLAMIRAHVASWAGSGVLVRWLVLVLCLPAAMLVTTLGLADSFFAFSRPEHQSDEAED